MIGKRIYKSCVIMFTDKKLIISMFKHRDRKKKHAVTTKSSEGMIVPSTSRDTVLHKQALVPPRRNLVH